MKKFTRPRKYSFFIFTKKAHFFLYCFKFRLDHTFFISSISKSFPTKFKHTWCFLNSRFFLLYHLIWNRVKIMKKKYSKYIISKKQDSVTPPLYCLNSVISLLKNDVKWKLCIYSQICVSNIKLHFRVHKNKKYGKLVYVANTNINKLGL